VVRLVILLIKAIKNPRIINPPGGSKKISMGFISPVRKDLPKIDPAPNISLTDPINTSDTVKPIPMPIPSKMESQTGFRFAKDSARAMIMQFTTINGMNKPNDSSNAGKKAFKINSIMVTNPAMTVMYAGIRTLSGMILLNNDMIILDPTKQNVVAKPIPKPFSADVVTANVGHIPNTIRNMGFSFNIPFFIILNPFIIKPPFRYNDSMPH
jgi:hypothetical protein